MNPNFLTKNHFLIKTDLKNVINYTSNYINNNKYKTHVLEKKLFTKTKLITYISNFILILSAPVWEKKEM